MVDLSLRNEEDFPAVCRSPFTKFGLLSSVKTLVVPAQIVTEIALGTQLLAIDREVTPEDAVGFNRNFTQVQITSHFLYEV